MEVTEASLLPSKLKKPANAISGIIINITSNLESITLGFLGSLQ